MLRLLDGFLRFGLLLLLVWTPLAFGAVHAWAFALLELHVFTLVAAWMLQIIWSRDQRVARSRHLPGVRFSSLALPLALFVALLCFQITPLPPALVEFLSPVTHNLYSLALPGWAGSPIDAGVGSFPSYWRPLSLRPYATRLELSKWLAYTGLFLLLINVLRSHRRIRLVSQTVVGVGACMALLGIVQKLSGTSAIYWWRDTSYAGFFGPFINHNHFAGYQSMAILLGLGLLFAQPPQRQDETLPAWRSRLLQWLAMFTQGRSLLVFALAVMTAGLFFSLSRGGVFSFLAGLLSFGGLLLLRQSGRRREVWAITLAAMATMILWLGIAPLLLRIEDALYGSDALTWGGRWPVFQGTWKIIADFPLFGVGYQAFAMIFPRYQPPGIASRYLYAHNDFLQLLAETGIVGFVLLIGGVLLLVASVFGRWRQRHDPLVRAMVPACLAAIGAMAVHSQVDFNLRVPANALLFTVLLALAYACVHLPRHGQAPASAVGVCRAARRHSRWTAVIPVLVLAAAAWLSFEAMRVALADCLYPQHRVLQRSHQGFRGDPQTQRHRLRLALAWTPDNPSYWRRLAELEDDTDVTSLRRATAAYRRALAYQPTDPYTRLGYLVTLQRLAGHGVPQPPLTPAERLALANAIARLAPAVAKIQFDVGRVLMAWDAIGGDVPADQRGTASLPFFRRAVRLDEAYYRRALQTYQRYLPPAAALALFAKTIPTTPQGHLRAAQALERPFWPQARLHYRVALILAPSDAAILRQYADSLQRHGTFGAARELWERLVRLTPDDARAYLGLAEASAGLGETADTVQTLRQLVDRFPRQAAYHRRLAEAYVGLGLDTKAEAVWKRLTTLLPHDPTAYVGLAHLYESRQDYAAAIAMLQRAIALEPGTLTHYPHLARLYDQNGKKAAAKRTMERLASLRPGDATVLYQLGEYFRQAGEYLQALVYYRRAVQLRPDQQQFHQAVQGLERLLRHRSGHQP